MSLPTTSHLWTHAAIFPPAARCFDVVSCQLSVVGCRLSVVSGQWSVVRFSGSLVLRFFGSWFFGSWFSGSRPHHTTWICPLPRFTSISTYWLPKIFSV